jgi:glucokinase
MTNGQWAIGVDLGGTNIDIAQVDEFGTIYKRLKLPTQASGGSESIKVKIVDAVKQICNDPKMSKPVGIGLGIAGQIERKTGLVKFAPNLGWENIHFQRDIEIDLDLIGISENDVRAAAWGEWMFGAGRGSDNVVCLFIGTGIGGGVITNGQLVCGTSNSAGEIGHIIVDLHGDLCSCGNYGCMESFAGGLAMARRAQQFINDGSYAGKELIALAGSVENITSRLIYTAAKSGDKLSNKVVNDAIDALVAGCISIIHMFNPEKLILGGGVIQGEPQIIDKIRTGVYQKAFKAATLNLEILPAQLADDSGVIGAASLAIQLLGKGGSK